MPAATFKPAMQAPAIRWPSLHSWYRKTHRAAMNSLFGCGVATSPCGTTGAQFRPCGTAMVAYVQDCELRMCLPTWLKLRALGLTSALKPMHCSKFVSMKHSMRMHASVQLKSKSVSEKLPHAEVGGH